MSAGARLQAAAMATLEGIEGLGVYPGPPLQAAFPHALVDAGLETDWSHKSGKGRELRLAVTIREAGERPERLQSLCDAAEAALEALPRDIGGWRVATFLFLRSRTFREPKGAWAAVIEYRARMLAAPG